VVHTGARGTLGSRIRRYALLGIGTTVVVGAVMLLLNTPSWLALTAAIIFGAAAPALAWTVFDTDPVAVVDLQEPRSAPDYPVSPAAAAPSAPEPTPPAPQPSLTSPAADPHPPVSTPQAPAFTTPTPSADVTTTLVQPRSRVAAPVEPTVRPLVLGEPPAEAPIYLPDRVICGYGPDDRVFGGAFSPASRFQRELATVRQRPVLRGASLRGQTPAQAGGDRQDSIGVSWSRVHRHLFLAVADGLASKPQSGQAAQRAVEVAVDTLTQRYEGLDSDLPHAVGAAADEISNSGVDGATTLAVGVVRPFPAGGAEVTLGVVGDTEGWLLEDGVWRAICSQRGNDQVLPNQKSPTLIPTFWAPAGSVLVLATSGFAASLGDGTSRLAEELVRRWARPPATLEFANLVGFTHGGATSDRTVLAVWL